MKRYIKASNTSTQANWEFTPDTKFASLPMEQSVAGSGLFGFDGAITTQMHSIENVEHLFEVHSPLLRSDAYIASGPSYFMSDKEQGDTVYAVGAIRSDLYPTRIYKYYTYEEAVAKANHLLKRNKQRS